MSRPSFVLAAVVSAIAASPARAAEPPVRRFALVAGANDGGSGRTPLRWAVRDAEGVAGVLTGLGGVATTDAVLLPEPRADLLRTALAGLQAKVASAKASGGRSEVVFYFSGHSDEAGLLLGGERLGYAELRTYMQSLPADVRITILDSCASGAVTRGKGGTHGPPFLHDASMRVEGQAFLTSSADDEVSQESDAVGGSFFTHFLLSGLRGAADLTGDGRVTLTEAYRFAYDRTLARTLHTRSGPQHPSFEIRLVGAGDFVLTDLRRHDASLLLPPAEGRWFVRDAEGRLLAEVEANPGGGPELALPRGRVVLALEQADVLRELALELPPARRVAVSLDGFVEVSRPAFAARGPVDGPAGTPSEGAARPFVFGQAGLFPPVSTYAGPPATHAATFGLLGTHAGALDGVGFTLGGHWTEGRVRGAQLAGAAAIAGEGVTGLQLSPAFARSGGPVRGAQLAGVAVAQGELRGVQVAPAVGFAEDVTGAQLGGVVVARDVTGLQAGAAIGFARDVRGVQLGAVNVARRVHGLQLGLVNVSEQHGGVPVGLVNWVRDGRVNLDAFHDASMPWNLAWRGGARHASTLLFAGFDPGASNRFRVGVGWGFHVLGAGPVGLDVDLLAWTVNPLLAPLEWNAGATVRANVVWQAFDWLALYAGPSANAGLGRPAARLGCCLPNHTWDDGRGAVWSGFQAGVRFGPAGKVPDADPPEGEGQGEVPAASPSPVSAGDVRRTNN